MEFIKWYSSGSVEPNKGLDKSVLTYHGIFRLDKIDQEMITPKLLEKFIKASAVHDKQLGREVSTDKLSFRIFAEDKQLFNRLCTKMFKELLINPYLTD